jgi:hypothetical protein
MAQVVRTIEEPLLLDGVPYRVQVCGRANGHIWEGWIEFAAHDGSDVRRTSRETTQPDREALVYWAEGLSGTYLEGAMARTLSKIKVTVRELPTPLFDGPEVSPRVEVIRNRTATEVERAVLDPFSVGAKGEELLRSELGALRDWHLRNIIRAYDLAAPSVDVDQLTTRQLIEVIVGAVQAV